MYVTDDDDDDGFERSVGKKWFVDIIYKINVLETVSLSKFLYSSRLALTNTWRKLFQFSLFATVFPSRVRLKNVPALHLLSILLYVYVHIEHEIEAEWFFDDITEILILAD